MSSKKSKFLLYPIFFIFILPNILNAETTDEIFSSSIKKQGLIVHIGCGDAKKTSLLYRDKGVLIHGLDSSLENIKKARAQIQSLGLYGPVSIKKLNNNILPYVDNMVNLIINENPGEISNDEIMRVLVPQGVAYIKQNNKWVKIIKPQPKDTDEWTHYRYDATGNPVANDTRISLPRHLQWEGEPRYSRSHETMSSVSAVVTSGGNIFSIIDEGPKASIYLPSQWFLTARDAYNGIILWKKPIQEWHTRLLKLKSGPVHLTRRLVAHKDRVYVTLGLYEPLSEIDSVTGEIIRTFKDTRYTEEIIYSQNKLMLVVNKDHAKIPIKKIQPPHAKTYPNFKHEPEYTISLKGERFLVVIDVQSGKTLWEKQFDNITPGTLASDSEHVFFHSGTMLYVLDAKSGNKKWSAEVGKGKLSTAEHPVLIVHKGMVYFYGNKLLYALSEKEGSLKWKQPFSGGAFKSPANIFVMKDLIWDVNLAREPYRYGKLVDNRIYIGYDRLTGEKKQEIPMDFSQDIGIMHHRCHMAKATGKYILTSYPGIEFVDTQNSTMLAHHWVRGACLYGILPANGLIYNPPHPCACYYKAKLDGFNAVSGTRSGKQPPIIKQRLEKGSIYSEFIKSKPSPTPGKSDWPTYRSDNTRSGYNETDVPDKLKQSWIKNIGGKLTQPVVAEDKVFIVSIDNHTLYSLNEKTGEILWQYTAEGRIDSPPTVYKGMVLFGSRDGYVYNLRASDGQLIWRFLAARNTYSIISYGQIESSWPVHGSILIRKNKAYFAAGRNGYLDEGINVYCLDALTGKIINTTCIYMLDKEGKQPGLSYDIDRLEIPGVKTDILTSDGKYIYMRETVLDFNAKKIDGPGNNHLFTPTGFLDNTWFSRTYWLYGNQFISGAQSQGKMGNIAPSGRILVFNNDHIFGFGRNVYPISPHMQMFTKGEQYILFSSSKKYLNTLDSMFRKTRDKKKKGSSVKLKLNSETRKPHVQWSHSLSIRVVAMVLSSQTLFFAGAKGEWVTSDESYEGHEGIVMKAVSIKDGSALAEYKLDFFPVFDGMVAANEKLFIAHEDGSLACWGK